jgi:copper chaperone NosL
MIAKASTTPAPVDLVTRYRTALRRDKQRRWAIIGLGVAGAVAFAGAYFLPWWNFHLVAPQYPMGLNLQIWLSGITGDVREIDILNHYIGMGDLAEAASTERKIGGHLIALVGITIILGLMSAGRKIGWAGLIPAFGLPLGFLGDTFYHMYRFGHDLDPAAPLNFQVFTPTLLGPGIVGQFHTWAWPAGGYWIALAGLAMVLVAVVLRRRVCNDCPMHDTCGAHCPQALVMGRQ